MKVLVSTASKHGSTAEIGVRIADVLRRRGLDVEVRPPAAVSEIASYDAVVLGSAVYAGHWRDDAKELVKRSGSALVNREVWLFSSGPVGDPPKPEEDPADAAPMVAATGARDHRVFAGRIDKTLLTLPERALVKAMRVPEGDYRDWDDVEGWASSIADALAMN
jgi:menaquinone-dependent protoporphyrinogen oxidase